MAGVSQQLRMGPSYYRERIEELEKIRGAVTDTGKMITIDEAELHRAVLDGQAAESIAHMRFLTNYVEPNQEPESPPTDTRIDEAMAKAREITEGGTLPKQKPLLYRLDFHRMDRERPKREPAR